MAERFTTMVRSNMHDNQASSPSSRWESACPDPMSYLSTMKELGIDEDDESESVHDEGDLNAWLELGEEVLLAPLCKSSFFKTSDEDKNTSETPRKYQTLSAFFASQQEGECCEKSASELNQIMEQKGAASKEYVADLRNRLRDLSEQMMSLKTDLPLELKNAALKAFYEVVDVTQELSEVTKDMYRYNESMEVRRFAADTECEVDSRCRVKSFLDDIEFVGRTALTLVSMCRVNDENDQILRAASAHGKDCLARAKELIAVTTLSDAMCVSAACTTTTQKLPLLREAWSNLMECVVQVEEIVPVTPLQEVTKRTLLEDWYSALHEHGQSVVTALNPYAQSMTHAVAILVKELRVHDKYGYLDLSAELLRQSAAIISGLSALDGYHLCIAARAQLCELDRRYDAAWDTKIF